MHKITQIQFKVKPTWHFQLFRLGKPEHNVVSDFSDWLTGAEPGVVFCDCSLSASSNLITVVKQFMFSLCLGCPSLPASLTSAVLTQDVSFFFSSQLCRPCYA